MNKYNTFTVNSKPLYIVVFFFIYLNLMLFSRYLSVFGICLPVVFPITVKLLSRVKQNCILVYKHIIIDSIPSPKIIIVIFFFDVIFMFFLIFFLFSLVLLCACRTDDNIAFSLIIFLVIRSPAEISCCQVSITHLLSFLHPNKCSCFALSVVYLHSLSFSHLLVLFGIFMRLFFHCGF